MTPILDAHAHFDPCRTSADISSAGAVLAMTLSLDEAELALHRTEPLVAWGVGCHPRKLPAQMSFDSARFALLTGSAPIIGEIGLDTTSRVPLDLQLSNLRAALSFASQQPRLISLHSYHACPLILDELRRTPVIAPILHWWTGTALETRQAVDLGAYFSVHSAVARRSIFRTQVPPERLLVESDHGWADPPAAIPHRIAWVEYLLSASLGMPVDEIRRLVWSNFSRLVRLTGTLHLLPPALVDLLPEAPHSYTPATLFPLP